MRNAAAAALMVLSASLLGLAPAEAEARSRRAEPKEAPASLGPCLDAIRDATREHRLPEGLLEAIARTESGRADPQTGRFAPWPWTINAEGQGQYFETKAQAIAAVEALRARGVTVIDVGCMQVNLHHHPNAFPSLEHAFDPVANARYAGLFLKRLHATRQDWEVAAAHYHSTTPERAEAYLLKVLANWPQMASRFAEMRQRQALAAAWTAQVPNTALRTAAFGTRPLVMTQRPMLHGQISPLLESVPSLRMVGRSTTTSRPILRLEVAEASANGGTRTTRR